MTCPSGWSYALQLGGDAAKAAEEGISLLDDGAPAVDLPGHVQNMLSRRLT